MSISVSDNGNGIDAGIQDKVMQPFFTTKEEGQGSGLGLSMVYGFVKQSGGTARIHSDPGIGTTIRLYFRPMTANSGLSRHPRPPHRKVASAS